MLLGAPGLTTSNKKLLVAKGIATFGLSGASVARWFGQDKLNPANDPELEPRLKQRSCMCRRIFCVFRVNGAIGPMG